MSRILLAYSCMQAVAGVPERARHVRAWQQELVLGTFWHGATAHGLMAAPASAQWAYGALHFFFVFFWIRWLLAAIRVPV